MSIFSRLMGKRIIAEEGKPTSRESIERNYVQLIEEGNSFEDEDKVAEALQRYEAAIQCLPDLPRAHLNRGNALIKAGDIQSSVVAYKMAIGLDPAYAAAHFNLGNAWSQLKQYDDALSAYRMALTLNPSFAQAHVAMGCVMQDLGKHEEAANCYRQATMLQPSYAEAHCNLGNVLKELGQIDDAVQSYQESIRIKPEYAEAHNNLADALQYLGQYEAAVASYRRALDINPSYSDAYSNLLFCLSHLGHISPASLFAEHLCFAERYEAPLMPYWPQHNNLRDPDRSLKIGFVSGDFRAHAVAYYIEPVLSLLSSSPEYSLHAYYNHKIEDGVTQRIKRHFMSWQAVAGCTDAELSAMILEARIDILVDVSSHTSGNRLMVFARKPAPIQVSGIGSPGTTGLSSIDYTLADEFLLPREKFDQYFTEKMAYLPAYMSFSPLQDLPPPNALPALSNGYITFGSFNRLNKLSPEVVAVWSKLLQALPDSKMILGGLPKSGEYGMLIGWFKQSGICEDRLIFYPHLDFEAYTKLHHRVDVCLDTFPYAGGVTSNLALWMGVPILTLEGNTAPGRQGVAALMHVGLDGFIAKSESEFVQLGCAWHDRLAELASIRAELRTRCERSPTRGPDIVAASLSRAFRVMWQRWCAGLPPESFGISC